MAQMRAAPPTGDLRPHHPVAAVFMEFDILLRNRLPETRPTCARVKLCIRNEQGRAAADASVEASFVIVPVFASEGSFRAGLAGDRASRCRQFSPPLALIFHNPRHSHGPEALTGI